MLETIYRLRYQVYVEEWGFEKPEDHQGGLERDVYDQHSVHIYATSINNDQVIGAARLILNSELAFPIERHFDIQNFPSGSARQKIAEISRLSISKKYRRRAVDRAIFRGDKDELKKIENHQNIKEFSERERRKCEHDLIRGIYFLIYRESLKLGLTHWYAVMAKGLHIILKRWGIVFEQLGPEREYHGLRAPYVLNITTLEQSLSENNPDLLNFAKQQLNK